MSTSEQVTDKTEGNSTSDDEFSISSLINANNSEEETNYINHVLKHPLDILSYLKLIQYYDNNDSFDKSRSIFKILNKNYPLYSTLWTLQLKSELLRDEFKIVEVILSNCLSGEYPNNDLSLWMTYLDYVRRKNNLITGGQEARSIVIKAFELVLNSCAIFEPISNQFWTDYLNFLIHWKAVNKWENQQRIDMIRKIYKKLLSLPIDNLEKFWNQYTQWEQEINNLTARKFIGEISADYMKARSIFLEWSNVTKGLKRSNPLKISLANKNNIPQFYNSTDENDKDKQDNIEQLQIWLDWLTWEKQNKLELSDDLLKKRITYVYNQAIQFMIFSPQIWYDYVMFKSNSDLSIKSNDISAVNTAGATTTLSNSSGNDIDLDPISAQKILNLSIQANPTSPLLIFKLAESFELNNNIDDLKKAFDNSIEYILKDLKPKIQEAKDNNTYLPLPLDIARTSSTIDPIYKQRYLLTYIYCMYMNTMKRNLGLSAARSVFGKCRKLKSILTHHIYIENAYLEFNNQLDYKTPCKVLELGLKYFQEDGIYINKYLDFLISINRNSQIKTLFEMSIDKINNKDQLDLIFKKMICYESKFGNLDNVYSLQKRFFEKFPNENYIDIFTIRYQLQNENLIKDLELTYLPKDFFPFSNLQSYSQFNNTSNINIFGKKKRSFDSASLNNEQNKKKSHIKKFKSHPNIPDDILDLLAILPKRQYFNNAILDPKKLISFLEDQVVIPEKNSSEVDNHNSTINN
ncbi:hypothetical protein TBLA_0C06430 [Henningerozyma blattae CBS 6284]|uniref:mRNA 3'-end-processing protein RNA14 n=1 Tax=Henningerozyma blattae (strain ATCC 34711 / CBS 6284 / DSM 70876 / NBRC 10599 / NRRL Y-10934 / UCD 77-7) TaxID=1071380 RepID=I2H234_HENB6|nr:hypothetical protein TBLA_0C06430 [Tetrapisispora blattae CBS 6284]CCH60436.1 hypothetical protein TBLA_0C06430 [Tetrapisispora blattae CBS 6284]